jgi:hypothetical protein
MVLAGTPIFIDYTVCMYVCSMYTMVQVLDHLPGARPGTTIKIFLIKKMHSLTVTYVQFYPGSYNLQM